MFVLHFRLICSSSAEIVEFSTVGSWDQHTCDNILVCHHAFQMSRAQIIKCVISGSKKSIVAWPAQLVHHTGSQCCSLGEDKCVINSPLMFFFFFFLSIFIIHLVLSTYTEGREFILFIQDVFNGFAYAADDPINHVHNPVCGHLVAVDDPGTVHGHDLCSEEKDFSR